MRKIAIWNNYTSFAKNQAFNPDAYGIGEDIGYPIILLKDRLGQMGYVVETLDMDSSDSYEKILFLDYPNPKTCCCDINRIPKERKYLLLSECEMIYKMNSDKGKYNEFQKVFSYNDDLVRDHNCIKLNIPNRMKSVCKVPFTNKKKITMIVGNKTVHEEGELYSARLSAIHYFEKNHLAEFDLYGIGWDKKYFAGPKIIRILNRFEFLQRAFAVKHPSYKGPVKRKIEILAGYKYAICYENASIYPGYITEKIWDCFFAGCVPVYWGAPNICDYIPKNTFIDRRNFTTEDEVYDYINNISEEQYNEYIHSIEIFLQSENAHQFSAESYVNVLISNMLVN